MYGCLDTHMYTQWGSMPGKGARSHCCGIALDFHGKDILEDPFIREWALPDFFCRVIGIFPFRVWH